jgi:hypothetical protein
LRGKVKVGEDIEKRLKALEKGRTGPSTKLRAGRRGKKSK